MTLPRSSSPGGGWRAEPRPRLHLRLRQHGNARRWFLVLGVGAVAALAVTAVLYFRSASPQPFFVPLCVIAYESPAFTANPATRADQERLCALFDRVGSADWSAPRRAMLLESLETLSQLRPSDDLVVYLSGQGVLTDAGISILPADALPDDPRTWMPLAEILAKLKGSPARQQLLLLDIAPTGASERVGTAAGISSTLAAALDAVPDERRLVLASCGPGQDSMAAPRLRGSAFGAYVAEGLRGAADGHGADGRRNGHVTVHELASFVSTHVERWSLTHRGVRQKPVLFGSARDFTLATVKPHDEASVAKATPPVVPAWLERARTDSERIFADGSFRNNPRGFERLQAIVADAEFAISFPGFAERESACLKEVETLSKSFEAASYPVVFSMALERAAHGNRSHAGVEKLQRSLAEAFAQAQQAKPPEAAKMEARFLANWPVHIRDAGAQARDAAVVAWVAEQASLPPAKVAWADALLRSDGDAEPRYAETLAVRLLADLAHRVPEADWSGNLAQQAWALPGLAELPLSYPEALAWFRPELDEAAQKKHEGEIALWSWGYVPRDRAVKLLGEAERRCLELNQRIAQLGAAQELADRATILLPGCLPLIEHQPDKLAAWEEAVRLTAGLLDAGATPPADAADRDRSLVRISTDAQILKERLALLAAPFARDRIRKFADEAQAASAHPALLVELNALLACGSGWLAPADRQSLSNAAFDLETRLLDQEKKDQLKSLFDEKQPHDVTHLRARCRLALLELGGVSAEQLAPLHATHAKLTENADVITWAGWGQAWRDIFGAAIPDQIQRETSLSRKERVSRILPPRETWPAFDTGEPSAARIKKHAIHDAAAWLAERYRYQARDYEGLGLDTPGIQAARRFYADAAGACAAFSSSPYVQLSGGAIPNRLSAAQVAATSQLTVSRITPTGGAAPTQLQVILPDSAWLDVTPDSASLPALKNEGPERILTTEVPLRISLKEGAERSQTPPPRGFLAMACTGGLTYHRLVPVPLEATVQEVQILVSSNPKTPEPALDELRLRPGAVRQSFFVYVNNLSPRPRSLMVEVSAGGGTPSKTPLRVGAGQRERVRFSEPTAPLDGKALPETQGPLEIRVLDTEKSNALLAARHIVVGVVEPRDYVRIAEAQVEPAPFTAGGKVSVALQSLGKIGGPSIPAQLVVPTNRHKPATIVSTQREIANQEKSDPVALSAETGRDEPSDEETPIYLTVDGVPRAFVFRTALGTPTAAVPRPDERLAVRIRAAASMQPAPRVPVTIEVDNAPAGARLEFAVANPERGATEIVRRYATARQKHIGFSTAGPDGGLVFDAAIRDWTATLDAGAWQGRRVLKARVLDAAGRELQHSVQELIIDATPPEEVAFIAPPAQAQKGTTLKLIAHGVDRDSDIKNVCFFVGKPADEQVPAETKNIAGFCADADHGLWGGSIALPDQHGPVAISVQFQNRAGLTKCATTTVELLDVDPATLRPGTIQGKILEGPRPQPGLTVMLRDDQGQEKRRVRTGPDGSFTFEGIAPGRYQIFCDKPESGRKVEQAITVSPGETKRVSLGLSL